MSSTHCFLRTENRSICHGLHGSEVLISHTCTFQRKRYMSTGNFMMYALGLFAESPIYCVDLKVNPNSGVLDFVSVSISHERDLCRSVSVLHYNLKSFSASKPRNCR